MEKKLWYQNWFTFCFQFMPMKTFPHLRLRLINPSLHWCPDEHRIVLRGQLNQHDHEIAIHYFTVVANAQYWVAWQPLYEAMLKILVDPTHDDLPRELLNRSVPIF